MKAYFKSLLVQKTTPVISTNEMESYRDALLSEMIKLGASENDFNLVCDNLIIASIINNRKAEDVAWAILQ